MEDANIYIRNGLGGKSGAKQKLSAKGSIKRIKSTMDISKMTKKAASEIGGAIGQMNSGSGSNLISKSLGKVGGTVAVIGSAIMLADKIASFGINLKEAKTGEQVWAHNARTTKNTILSLGTNYLFGAIQNEIFTKKVISRQNYGLDYGRELYNINNEGQKNKRI
jgi:hypothetical protein